MEMGYWNLPLSTDPSTLSLKKKIPELSLVVAIWVGLLCEKIRRICLISKEAISVVT